MRAFRQGLKDIGYVEGENVALEYLSANNETERLPELASDLVRKKVGVIAAVGTSPRWPPRRPLRRYLSSSRAAETLFGLVW